MEDAAWIGVFLGILIWGGIIWFICSLAKSNGRSEGWTLAACLIFTPFIGILVALLGPKAAPTEEELEAKRRSEIKAQLEAEEKVKAERMERFRAAAVPKPENDQPNFYSLD